MLKPLNSSKIFAHSSIIFVILFIIYAISYNGVPGTDDKQLFISEARNWVDNGELTAPQFSLQHWQHLTSPAQPAHGPIPIINQQ